VKEPRTGGVEQVGGNRSVRLPAVKRGQKARDRSVSRCLVEYERHLARGKAIEDRLQALVLDTPTEGATTHHPRLDRHVRTVDAARDNGNLSERAEAILVGRSQQIRVRVAEVLRPLPFGRPAA